LVFVLTLCLIGVLKERAKATILMKKRDLLWVLNGVAKLNVSSESSKAKLLSPEV